MKSAKTVRLKVSFEHDWPKRYRGTYLSALRWVGIEAKNLRVERKNNKKTLDR